MFCEVLAEEELIALSTTTSVRTEQLPRVYAELQARGLSNETSSAPAWNTGTVLEYFKVEEERDPEVSCLTYTVPVFRPGECIARDVTHLSSWLPGIKIPV